ncbi:MAG: pyridoxal-dependent decarboxylase, partial [Acidobacteriota bacterium]
MNDRTLDANVEEFRKAGHEAVDWIARYLQTVEELPVLSSSAPGFLEKALAASPSESGRSYEELLSEFRETILPGITHWNHPAFFAYFSITGSQAGILGELLSAALNVNGMLWKTSPAATELETITLGWLRDLLGLPPALFGIINDTASINTFLALAAARESLGLSIRAEGMTGRSLPQLRIYCS